MFCFFKGDATFSKVLGDNVKPSRARCTSGSPPSGRPRIEVEDGTGWVFWRDSLGVSIPAGAALSCEARGGWLLRSSSDLLVGDVLSPMDAFDGSERFAVEAIEPSC